MFIPSKYSMIGFDPSPHIYIPIEVEPPDIGSVSRWVASSARQLVQARTETVLPSQSRFFAPHQACTLELWNAARLGISQQPDPAVSGRSPWRPEATFPPWPELLSSGWRPGDDLFRRKNAESWWSETLNFTRPDYVSSRFQSEGGTLPSGRWSRNSLHPLPAPRPRCLKAARQPQVREAWHIVIVESLELTWPRTLGEKSFQEDPPFVCIDFLIPCLFTKQVPGTNQPFKLPTQCRINEVSTWKKKAPKTGLVNHLHPFSRSLWEMWVLY